MPKPTDILRWNKEAYNIDALRSRSEEELRAEYARLRQIAHRRLKSIAGSEFESYAQLYQAHKQGFKAQSDIKTVESLRKQLNKLEQFVSSPMSTVQGLKHQRRAAVEQLRKRGYGFVNIHNFKEFTEFMEQWKARYKGMKNIGSPTPEELQTYMAAEKAGIDPKDLEKNFEEYMKHRKHLEEYVKEKELSQREEKLKKKLGIKSSKSKTSKPKGKKK